MRSVLCVCTSYNKTNKLRKFLKSLSLDPYECVEMSPVDIIKRLVCIKEYPRYFNLPIRTEVKFGIYVDDSGINHYFGEESARIFFSEIINDFHLSEEEISYEYEEEEWGIAIRKW